MDLPGIVDVHSHVVPSGDDGARSVEQGVALCRLAFDAGTRVLFATPHAHAPWDSYPWTNERAAVFEAAFPRVREAVSAFGLELRRGREAYPSIVGPIEPAELALEGTRAVLVEFPGSWLDVSDPVPLVAGACERIEAAGLVALLAHPERCTAVSRNPASIEELVSPGRRLCLNGPSLLGLHGRAAERTAWRLLDDDVVSLVASDGHGLDRPPVLEHAYRAVARRYGAAAAAPLFDGSGIPI